MEEENKQEVAVIPQNGFMEIIDKVAQLPGMETVEKLERLMTMQLKWEDRQSEREFSEAMSRISQKLSHVKVVRNREVAYAIDKNNKESGTKTAFKYAAIEDIDAIVRPFYDAEDIEVSYDMQPLPSGWYMIEAKATRGLHSRKGAVPMPLDTSGGKNNAQGAGSTNSYGKRQALCNLFNIVTVGLDDDAQGGAITEEQAKEIKEGLAETGLDTIKFLKVFKAESVDEIRTKDLPRARSALDAKRWQIHQETLKKEEK